MNLANTQPSHTTGTISRLQARVSLLHSPCQSAFTLIELLVVITIIGILASALVVSVKSAYRQARQASCKSNLRQFGVALNIYRGEHDNVMPDWISNLYPDYVDDRAMYVCHADPLGGNGRIRPALYVEAIHDSATLDAAQFRDNTTNPDNARNRAVQCCSYFYEFSNGKPGWGKDSSWPDGDYSTLKAYKMAQLQYGDSNNKDRISGTGAQLPYSASAIPMIRCYHHWHDQSIYGVAYTAKDSRAVTKQWITLNVAYAGNVFVGPPWWEGTIRPGETQH